MRTISIVGASQAGISAAQALRKSGFDGTISILGEEVHSPYQRPPLSKQFLSGKWDRMRLDLRAAAALQLEWHLGSPVLSLDIKDRTIELARGHKLGFDGLIIATGARARKPSWYVQLEGVFTLRTIDDATALREYIGSGRRSVVIAGAGFIGLEAAATLRGLGCEVTMVDVQRLPMAHVLGDTLAEVCLRLHRDHGVHTILGRAVSSVIGRNTVEAVRLDDGAVVDADCLLVGIGAAPNVEWLQKSGLALGNGVLCDSTCMAIGAPRVVAAGDVASWQHPYFGRIRVEHWNNAVEQGEAAARTLLAPEGAGLPYSALPFFWSDQYDCKMQLLGLVQTDDTMRVVEGSLAERRFVALFERDSRISAAFLFNSAHRMTAYRQMVTKAADAALQRDCQ